MSREAKVGLLVVAALVVVAAAIFLVGERSNLFVLKNSYSVRFATVAGLAEGNPVQLNGVTVGHIEEVVLPVSIEDELLTVWLSIDRRFADRVREDSLARIKTLGLLGDKYVEISSGSPAVPPIPSGGSIPAAPATDVDHLISSGEDAVDNVVAISYSLREILGRMERGEGLLGELLVDDESARRTRTAVIETVESVQAIAERLERGEGTLGELLADDQLAQRIQRAVGELETTLERLNHGDGALPALLNDPEMRTEIDDIITKADGAATDLSELAAQLADGDGLLQRLLADAEYADAVTERLRSAVENLEALLRKVDQGEGTLGLLIEDPQLYQAIDDVVVGVNESKLLRWLVRNRQKAGIEKRYREVQQEEQHAAEPLSAGEAPQ